MRRRRRGPRAGSRPPPTRTHVRISSRWNGRETISLGGAVSSLPNKDLDRLYGLPLDEFTRERNDLAKRLRAEGEREAAEAVGRLKKPNLPAWAVNQLIRRHRKEVRKLLEAGKRLRDAHERLLARGDRKAVSDAAAKERELVSALVGRAEPLLSEAGSPSAANLERISNTLHAAALDEDLRQELEAGRVVSDREPVGLGPFAAAPAGGERRGATKKQRANRTATQKNRELREARKGAEEAEKRLRTAERSLEGARADAEEAHRALRKAEQRAESARAELQDAKAAVERVERTREP
jgi:hypothetical protein